MSAASFVTPLKLAITLLLGFLFLSLTFDRKAFLIDPLTTKTYFLLFIPLMLLSTLYLNNFKSLYQVLNIEVPPHFYNPTAILLAIIVPVVSSHKNIKKSDPLYISFVLWIAFIVSSISETAVLILIVGLALALLPTALKRLIKYVVAFAVLTMPAIVEAAHKIATTMESGGSYTVRLLVDRITIWHSYYTEYGGRLWGVGENIMRRVENPAVVDIDGGFESTHPHNAFLQAHVELGMLGAVALSALVFLLFLRIESSESRYRDPMVVCLALCILSRVATHSLWSTNATLLIFISAFLSKFLIDYLDRKRGETTQSLHPR